MIRVQVSRSFKHETDGKQYHLQVSHRYDDPSKLLVSFLVSKLLSLFSNQDQAKTVEKY